MQDCQIQCCITWSKLRIDLHFPKFGMSCYILCCTDTATLKWTWHVDMWQILKNTYDTRVGPGWNTIRLYDRSIWATYAALCLYFVVHPSFLVFIYIVNTIVFCWYHYVISKTQGLKCRQIPILILLNMTETIPILIRPRRNDWSF